MPNINPLKQTSESLEGTTESKMTRLVFATLLQLIIIAYAQTRDYTDEEIQKLPKLFHLDHYDQCLLRKSGVYCVGKFQIYTDVHPNPTFDLIQEYSQDETNYNRTFLYRGYCLNTRCPSAETNLTARFEKCVDQWARTKSLRTRIHTLHYCHTRSEARASKPLDAPRLIFLYAVCFILLMNAVGTIYDLFIRNRSDNKKANGSSLLMAWSIPANWTNYVTIYEPQDPRLRAIQGLEAYRVVIAFMTVFMHSNLVDNRTFHLDAGTNEKFLRSFVASTFQAVTTSAQIYVLLFCFTISVSILKDSEKHGLQLKSLPKFILKKLARLWPLHVLAVGFAASWLPDIGDGPVWPVLIDSESDACRHKFWPQILFLQNYFHLDKSCLTPTWVLTVQAQLCVFFSVMIFILIKYRKFNFNILSIFYLFTLVLTFLVVYINDFKPVHIISTPEYLFPMLVNNRTYRDFYIYPINCIVIATAGIILGYVHYYYYKPNDDDSKYKGCFSFMSKYFVPTAFLWASLTHFIRTYQDPLFTSVYMVLDRLVISAVLVMGVFSSFRITDNRFLSWNGWRFMTRILYAVAVIHWQIDMFLVSRKRITLESGLRTTSLHAIFTWVLALLLALPLTILVDFPLQKIIGYVLSKLP